jgi:hypothetical protein
MTQLLHHEETSKVPSMQSDQTTKLPATGSTGHTFSALRIGGKDRIEFLQGQLTQDVALLSPTKPLLAGWNTAKGRLLCICWLVEWQDAIWMLLPDELRSNTAKRLKMFVLSADVDISEDAITVELSTSDISKESRLNTCYTDDYYSFESASGAALTLGSHPHLTAMPEDDWRLAHIRAGRPWVWQATTDEFVAQMLNLDLLNAISFNKGCYVGQEIIARTQNLGRIKRRMYGFRTDNTGVKAGQPVLADGNTVGQIVDAVTGESGTELLAVVRIEATGEDLRVLSDAGPLLEPFALPYEHPDSIQP